MQTKDKKEDRSLLPIGVFWDIENCQVPRGKSATALVGHIRQLFFSGHAEAEFLCVCDIRKERPEVVQELNLAQVTVVHINATSKNAADDKLKQCMRRYVDIHGSPATLMLISGDVNFSTELSDFRHRRQIRVVILHGSSAPEALTACAHECYSFAQVAAGVPFRTPQPKGQPRCCELVVQDLPTDREYSLVHNRLRQLSDNCGGRVLSIAGPRAVLRFPTPDAALRASKRMDGEDVFGSTIAVGLHDTRRRRSRGLRAGSKRSSSSSTSQSPESSSAEADSYHLSSSHRESGDFETDTWRPEVVANSVPGLQAETSAGVKKSRSVGRVSPFFRCSSQPEVPTTHHVSGEVAAMSLLSLRTSSVSPAPRLCTSAKSTHLHGRATSEHSGSSGGGVERPRIRPKPQDSPKKCAPKSPQGQKNTAAKARLQDSVAPIEPGPIEVHITNLDPRIEATELKKMLLALFQEHVTVLHLSLLLQPDSSLKASVKVPSLADARKAVECLHQRRLGLHCLHLSFDEAEVPPPLQQQTTTEPVYCALHYNPTSAPTVSSSASGVPSPSPWALWVALPTPLPDVSLSRTEWITRLGSLLDSHTGSLPLDSFQACYEAEFGPLPVGPISEPWKEGCVPLEHLVLSVPGVNVVTSPQGFKRATREPAESRQTPKPKGNAKGRSLPALEELSREMMELLSEQHLCSLPLRRFIPAYHRHFGRQCRLADYGCTKLLDLLAAIGHVVEVLGYGHTRVLTLTHEAQMKRFAADVRRLFGQADVPKSLLLSSLPHHFREVHQRQLDVADYGACSLDDLLEAVPKSVLVVEQRDGNTVLTVPERVPTAEEAERLRQFAKELVLLLTSTGNSGLLLSQLSPAYQQHFGRKLRATEYGPFRKLLPLLQAIPDVAQVCGAGNRRMVRLAPGYQLPTPADSGDQSSPARPLQSPVGNQEVRKGTEDERKKRQEEESLLDLLLEQPGGGLDLGQLWEAFNARCGTYPSMPLLRRLEAEGYISLDRKAGRMRLSPRHLLARQLRRLLVLHEPLCPSLPLARLEEAYRERHGAPPPICQLGFPCLEGFLLSLPKYFNLSGSQEALWVSLADSDTKSGADTLNSSAQHGTPDKLAPEDEEEVSSEPATTINLEVDAGTAGSSENGSEPELLKLCPDDLLDRPIPSGIPSPVIRPEVSPPQGSVTAETTDLMQFDQSDCAAGSNVAVASAKLFDSMTTSAAPRARRRIAAFFPVPLAQ